MVAPLKPAAASLHSSPQGRYPSACFFYKGVWYYGTYALENYQAPTNPPPNCGNWYVCGL